MADAADFIWRKQPGEKKAYMPRIVIYTKDNMKQNTIFFIPCFAQFQKSGDCYTDFTEAQVALI